MKIEDLKNIDLKKIDLSKIDLNQLIAQVLEKKDQLGQAMVVVGFIIFSISLWGGYQEQAAQNQKDIDDLNAKISAIQGYDEAQSKSKKFYATLPKEIDEDQISSEISDYATANNITIGSLSSGTRKSEGFSDIISLQITAVSADYKDLLSFLKTIETSQYAFRLESCAVIPDPAKETSLQAQISISYVKVKK